MATKLIKRNMRLFGLPYQFMPEVDPRVPTISNTIGHKFAENIIMDAPVITIIPGRPKYLANAKAKDKQSTAQALLDASTDLMSPLKTIMKDKNGDGDSFRYYDFERSYTEYMKYVNILCRTCASFLEIDEKIDGESCQRYDYRNYKWNTDNERGSSSVEKIYNNTRVGASTFLSNLLSKLKNKEVKLTSSDTNISANETSNTIKYETTSNNDDNDGTIEDLLTNYNYVQFFVDTDASAGESMSNTTSESKIKGLIDQVSNDYLKEFAFITQSAGIDTSGLTDFVEQSSQALADSVGAIGLGSISSALSSVLSLGGNVVKGENIIMPDIYQNSTYDKSYTFTVHLKTPYGTKFGYFMDICVPLMHLIGLGLPKQTSANTYGSPFLVKAYCEGIFTCNLGMVTSIQVSKGINSAYSADGLPTEVDVSVTIADLYSDLSMSPQNSPILFVNNGSLVEYLATTCGLSLIQPNINARLSMIANVISNAFMDVPDTVASSITEAADKFLLDFFGLEWGK